MKFTVFTGCYNSAPYIERVFKSLKSQTHEDFEWIAIDDCSSDNTVALIQQFARENPDIDITLVTGEKNQGVAANRRRAIQMAKGDLFVTWDHDDIAKPQQLFKLNQVWLRLGNASIANIFSKCENQFGKQYGNDFPGEATVGNYLRYYKNYFMGSSKGSKERQVCSRVEVLKQFIGNAFPEGRVPDGDTLWASIALKYDSIMLNEVSRVYYNDPENLNNLSTFTRSERAWSIYTTKLVWVNHFVSSMGKDPLIQLRYMFALTFYAFLADKSMATLLKDVKSCKHRIIIVAMALPAKAAIWYMKIRGKGL